MKPLVFDMNNMDYKKNISKTLFLSCINKCIYNFTHVLYVLILFSAKMNLTIDQDLQLLINSRIKKKSFRHILLIRIVEHKKFDLKKTYLFRNILLKNKTHEFSFLIHQ